VPYYWCDGRKPGERVIMNVEAISVEDAVHRFFESNDCLPDAIDGRPVRAYCTTCDAVVFEGEYHHDSDDGNTLCLGCLTGHRR
jgi:hypothetical protein